LKLAAVVVDRSYMVPAGEIGIPANCGSVFWSPAM